MNSGVSKFRGFGQPRERPHNETSVDPTLQRMISDINADTEAKRLRIEAEVHTPEGRKKAAEEKLAERKMKERNWISRVIHDRGNGWKPIWGTAEDEELRIYTLVDGGEHRFWGIKPIGMGIDDFWEKYDPEVRRYEDRQQETPVNPDAPAGPLIGEPLRSLAPEKAAARPRKRQKTPEISSTHRVQKSTKKTRKSPAHKADAGHPRPEDQMQEAPTAPHASGMTTPKKIADPAPNAQQQPSEDGGSAPSTLPQGRPAPKAKAATKEDTLASKRSRGRPPARRKPTERPPNQKRTLAVKGNARITKPTKKEWLRPSPPSVHKMRTRREGPAEPLQLP
ncbi:hypothetical protein IMSHALPRED_002239 [Imshaugia aleurites]|uniref:Uncharacterized protein n=1 Tax=Imshaugia aleurites TaxID=172621 RepID=A0A8H3PID3_9LECA|nr:hypothetical protein IMSHALPRED_002239 [Imshaugia aleurites]